MSGEDDATDVGSVAEEAAKLMEALQDWAKGSGATAGAAARNGAGFLHDVNAHIATGQAECTYCPICQVIAAVRATSPEVKQHLTVAASSLLQAAAGLLETKVPEPRDRQQDFEHIDLSDDGDWEDRE